MKTKIIQLTLLIVISGLIGYKIGESKVSFEWKNFQPALAITKKEAPPRYSSVDFSQFWTVWDKLESMYYDKKALDPKKLVNGAIAGMVEGLEDPYTVYLPPKQNEDFKQGLAGRFEGIGAELGMKGKQIIVVAPLDGSPAQKAGIRPGDAILSVDKQATVGWTLSQTVDKIRGTKGTEVVLGILHRDANKPVDVAVIRDTIQVKSVFTWIKKVKDIDEIKETKTLQSAKDATVAYIRLSQFGDNTNKEWIGLINALDLQIQGKKNFKGVILDLRNNPGGYLTDAVFIASEFVKEGTIVVQENRNGEHHPMTVSRRGLLLDVPVVILLNKGSASASEIVSGALRDYKRATIVGETSFGKGTIQQAEDLGGGAGLHVTIAKWLTPEGTWLHNKGLTPDVTVALDEKDPSHDTQLEKAVEELVKS